MVDVVDVEKEDEVAVVGDGGVQADWVVVVPLLMATVKLRRLWCESRSGRW